jgi:hypothetical protein
MRVIKLKTVSWAEPVAWMWEKINSYKILVAKREGKKPLGKLGVDGSNIKWVFIKSCEGVV